MGRRDAVAFTLECVAEWRRLGALVTFEPGWETRGNGTSADYEGTVEHHTATPSSPTRPFPTRNMLLSGRSDLPGPLCNEATPVGPQDRPQIHVIAAHPANHAGASGGKNMGPLPVTRLFNPRVRGNEIDYAGSSRMTPGQYQAALIHGRGVVNVLRRDVSYIRAHAETSVTGKWDPGYASGKTIDMNAFRRDADALGATPPSPDPQEDDDMPQAISHSIQPGKDLVIPIPPVNSGAAGWGAAWASVAVDLFKKPARPVAVRVGIMDSKGKYRPMFGSTFELMVSPGTRPALQLADGDQAIVVSNLDAEAGVGFLLEYARR